MNFKSLWLRTQVGGKRVKGKEERGADENRREGGWEERKGAERCVPVSRLAVARLEMRQPVSC